MNNQIPKHSSTFFSRFKTLNPDAVGGQSEAIAFSPESNVRMTLREHSTEHEKRKHSKMITIFLINSEQELRERKMSLSTELRFQKGDTTNIPYCGGKCVQRHAARHS